MNTIRLNPFNLLEKNSNREILCCRSALGNYLLTDGKSSQQTVYGRETGVFLERGVVVPFRKFEANQQFDVPAAWERCRTDYGRIPTLGEIFPLLTPSGNKAFNEAMRAIGRPEEQMTGDILNTYWYKEILDYGYFNKRHLLLVSGGSPCPSLEAMSVDNGNCVVAGDGRALIKVGDAYLESSWEIWDAAFRIGLNFFLLDNRYLFVEQHGNLRYLDKNPRYDELNGIIYGDTAVYQLIGNMKCGFNILWMQSAFEYGVSQIHRQNNELVVRCSGEAFYGGGEQYIRGEYVDVYDIMENGCFCHREHCSY